MNINIYLEDELAEELRNMAKNFGKSRNLVIREALKEYILHHGVRSWPKSVQTYNGTKNFPSFESYRTELKDQDKDLFE